MEHQKPTVNILGRDYAKAQDGLQHEANQLYDTAQTQQDITQDNLNAMKQQAVTYKSSRPWNPERGANNNHIPAWIQTIVSNVYRPPGKMGGTDVNRLALHYVSDWLGPALELGYNLQDPKVAEQFAQVCLAIKTSGFRDKDTKGTTVGENIHGKTAMGAGLGDGK